MKYMAQLIDGVPRERPILIYSNSLPVVLDWAKLRVSQNPEGTVKIFEQQEILIKEIRLEKENG